MTFVTTATETQSAVIPSDFDRFLPGTVWNRTKSRRVVGPLGSERYQMLQASVSVSTWDAFRIRGGAFLMFPTPDAGDTIAFEYVKNTWCTDSTGTTYQTAWVADSDLPVLDDEIMTLGIVWRFLQQKGLAYGEAFRSYENAINAAAAEDGGYDLLDLNSAGIGSVYDPYVPDGDWSVT